MMVTTHPLLVPWSRKSRGIPLLPLWVVQPVHSPSDCIRVHFTFTYTDYNNNGVAVKDLSFDNFKLIAV